MDFNLSEEQRMLRETARGFLQARCPGAHVRDMEQDPKGFSQELWQEMADLGWMGLIIPEPYEGVGGDFLDLVLLLEEMGRVALPGPFFSTVVLGALPLLETATEEQKTALLPRIARGELRLTLAHTEPGMKKYDPFAIETIALEQGDHFLLDGTKLFVPDAHVAHKIICVAKMSHSEKGEADLGSFLVDSTTEGVEVSPLRTLAGDKQFEVRLSRVRTPLTSRVGTPGEGRRHVEAILQKASVAKCAEMVGGGQKVLDMATAYAKEREQFGKPIGSFQAVQHHCANMLMDIEGSRYITYKVAWMLSRGIPCHKEVAVAKAWVSEAYKRIVLLGHQVQGATAYMVEHDMPLYSRRAKAAEMAFGDAAYHYEQVAQAVGL